MAHIEQVKCTNTELSNCKTDLLVFGMFENKSIDERIEQLGNNFADAVTTAISLEKFEGKSGKTVMVYGDQELKRIAVIGLGKFEEYNPDVSRDLGAKITKMANCRNIKNVTIDINSFTLTKPEMLQAFTEGMVLAGYEFLEYKSDKKDAHTLTEITLNGEVCENTAKKAKAIADAVCFARDVSNHPANFGTPTYLAEQAQKLAGAPNFKTTIIDGDQFEKLGLNAFYGVARGAVQPAKLILMEYQGGGAAVEKPFALVGKGVTFDSGGISLKPGAKMDEMKFDMCGSATVLGVMQAVAELQPQINIIAAIGATENMPDGDAQRPGDIVKAYNGKTIEILNTDAEGRLVLADVLAYVADKYKPVGMLDFATLTGAILIALGHKTTGIMGNNNELISQVKASGAATGEKVWELPLWKEYSEDIKSKIADLKNMGQAREAGSIAAGVFLKEFVNDIPWCHLDIAGTAWGAKKPAFLPKVGATGVGVRLVYDLLENRIK